MLSAWIIGVYHLDLVVCIWIWYICPFRFQLIDIRADPILLIKNNCKQIFICSAYLCISICVNYSRVIQYEHV